MVWAEGERDFETRHAMIGARDKTSIHAPPGLHGRERRDNSRRVGIDALSMIYSTDPVGNNVRNCNGHE